MTEVFITLKFAKEGVQTLLDTLAQLPYDQSAGLIREIEAQANFQLDQMRLAAETAAQPNTSNQGE